MHPFLRVYIADLDAIRGTGDNRSVIARLRRDHPHLELWLDAGFRSPADLAGDGAAELGRPVIGSESLTDRWHPRDLAHWHPAPVLSLDFQGSAFLGPPALWREHGYWPRDIILMTLSHVGMNGGPAVDELERLQARVPNCNIYAAGGVRDASDLALLRGAGAAGALVATALHSGALSRNDLAPYG